MKKLYEIARLIRFEDQIVETFLSRIKRNSVRELHNQLHSNPEITVHEAMLALYGKRDVKKFSEDKAVLKEIYLKAVSIQGVSNFEEETRYDRVLDSIRDHLAARILMYKGSRQLAIEIIEGSLLKNTWDNLSSNVLEQLRVLSIYYGTSVLNKYKLEKYLQLEDYYLELFLAERKVLRYYIDLKKAQLHSLSVSEDDRIKAVKYSDELKGLNYDSRTFKFYKFQIFAKRYEYMREYNELLCLCKEAEEEFISIEKFSLSSLIAIHQVRLWTLIQLGRFDECIISGQSFLNNDNLSSTNWYSIIHYIIKASIYNLNYVDATKYLFECFNHPKYSKLAPEYKELAELNLGYLHLIKYSGVFALDSLALALPDFRIAKFLNKSEIFSKDKRGVNVSMLLLHIAFLLLRKDYNAIIDRTDSLNQYAYRYLRKDDSFRSNCMIKMVIQMTKADFNPIRTDRYTADLRKQLGNVSLAGSGENIEVEIIPFEVLWDIMRKSL